VQNVARLTKRPVTILARDSAGLARIVYAGKDAVECERAKLAASRRGWTLIQTVVHEPEACASLAGLARPRKPGHTVTLPLCAARGRNTPDRDLFAYVTRLALQH
jgi:hypothetical protein